MDIVPKLEIIRSFDLIQLITNLLSSKLTETSLFNITDILNSLGNNLIESHLYLKNHGNTGEELYVRITN